MIRFTFACAATALSLSACSPTTDSDALDIDAPPPASGTEVAADIAPDIIPDGPTRTAGYDDNWAHFDFWSGEYPNGFAIAEAGVTVMGHAEINRDAEPTLACPLPHKATYSPWNGGRVETDQLEFISMVYQTPITINEDVTVDSYLGDVGVKLTLKAGDVLTYRTYLGEGYYMAEKDGDEYELGQSDLPESTVFGEGLPDEEWVRVTCADAAGRRAWLRYEDALATTGVERYNYTGYGEAADLP